MSNRTMAQLCFEAIRVQDACNMVAIANSFAKAVQDLRGILKDAGTYEVNTHHVVVLWAAKMLDLSTYGAWQSPNFEVSYQWCLNEARKGGFDV